MKIRQFYSPRLLKSDIKETLHDAAARMDEHQVGALAVVDGEELVGVISERDVTRAMAQQQDPGRATVAEYMSLHVATVDENDLSTEVAQKMLAQGVRHLLVTKGGEPVGMVSIRDLLALELWGPPGIA